MNGERSLKNILFILKLLKLYVNPHQSGVDNIDKPNRIELYHGEHLLIFHQCLQQQWMLTTTVNNRASFL